MSAARTPEALAEALAPEVQRALLLGTLRIEVAPPPALVSPGRDPARWPHAAAALATAATRLRRPRVPEWRQLAAAPPDPRPRLAETTRVALLRLVEAPRDAVDDELVHGALAAALRDAGVALHPFDLPRLARLVHSHDFVPGPTEAAWLDFVRARAASDPAAVLDDSEGAADVSGVDWRTAPLAGRLQALRARRSADPAAGRASIAGALTGEPAAARAKLVATLEVGLGPDDLPLLEPLRTDRSQLVKDAVARLLVRIPGTPEAVAQLGQASACIERKEARALSKLLRRGPKLTLAVPEQTRKGGAVLHWALGTFRGLTLADLASALGLAQRALVEGSEDDAILQTVLFAAALEGAERAAATAAKPAPDTDLWDLTTHLVDLDWSTLALLESQRDTPRPERASIVSYLRPDTWTELPSPHELGLLHRARRGPLLPYVADALVASDALQRFVQALAGPGDDRATRSAVASAPAMFIALAALCGRSASARAALREHLSSVPLSLQGRAPLLLDVLAALATHAATA